MPASRDGAVLVGRGTRAGIVLGVLGGLVSATAVWVLGDGQDAGLLLAAAVVTSAAVGGITGAVGASLVRSQLGSDLGVRPLPVVVVTALVALAALLLLSAVLGVLLAGPALAGVGAVLALVRVGTLARAAREGGALPPVVL